MRSLPGRPKAVPCRPCVSCCRSGRRFCRRQGPSWPGLAVPRQHAGSAQLQQMQRHQQWWRRRHCPTARPRPISCHPRQSCRQPAAAAGPRRLALPACRPRLEPSSRSAALLGSRTPRRSGRRAQPRPEKPRPPFTRQRWVAGGCRGLIIAAAPPGAGWLRARSAPLRLASPPLPPRCSGPARRAGGDAAAAGGCGCRAAAPAAGAGGRAAAGAAGVGHPAHGRMCAPAACPTAICLTPVHACDRACSSAT